MLIVVAVLHFIFVLHFIVVLHSFCSSFCCCYSSFHCFLCDVDLLIAFQSHPSLFRGLSLGFYTHFILSAQPIAEWFATLSFSTIPLSSYRERYGFEWALFYPQALFYLTLLHWHFTCVYQGLPGSRQFFLEVCRASCWSSKHRLTHLLVWFIATHNLHIQN